MVETKADTLTGPFWIRLETPALKHDKHLIKKNEQLVEILGLQLWLERKPASPRLILRTTALRRGMGYTLDVKVILLHWGLQREGENSCEISYSLHPGGPAVRLGTAASLIRLGTVRLHLDTKGHKLPQRAALNRRAGYKLLGNVFAAAPTPSEISHQERLARI